uniref:Single-stranded-DNA-specific exonuclease RecJ n=1 Tax=Candidatus Kentrum sp. SD TaxID=2126332 RepID=A0A450Z489_9GAMM|nr:MAG: single-stranded-DNA-specific exonuclease [Candidatus Kentron sp. SD]VFK48625.1 MAG: single-stranded-DNA-specific exonuclease [Candidatus Kentron sp. SD]VFK80668.1 MAG: single-stranded-DNA-specific exonuclease [Candidatus Kentron sp. SD]
MMQSTIKTRSAKRIARRPVTEGAERLFPRLHPVLARVYAARAIPSAESIDYSLARLAPFDTLSGIESAAALLAGAIRSGERILIVGDFDADGATSCAVAVRGLRLMGAQADYLVPNRFEYGYGLTKEIVSVVIEKNPDVLITVDNGISNLEGVAMAKAHGIRVLITDHHLPGDALPDADVIVNPNLAEDRFPSKCLAGVGVIFYVLLALRSRLQEEGWFEDSGREKPNMGRLLDLVALGTVADVVPLDENNRILVAEGLKRIRREDCQAGIKALLAVSKRDPERAVASDLAFAVGPRLNAAGRLTDMSLGIECLLADQPERALELAAQLDQLNHKRQDIELTMRAQALRLLDDMEFGDADDSAFGLCLHEETWHPGIIGIVASRIKDHVYRPVIAFAKDGIDNLRGSARSIPGLHVRDTLSAIATRNPALILRFGGHAMAAGLTIRSADLAVFRDAFDAEARRHLPPEALRNNLYTDGTLEEADFNLELAEALRAGGPWGQAFPEPSFDGEFHLLHRRVVGGSHLKLLFGLPASGRPIDAIAFNTSDDDWPEGTSRARVVYRLDVNAFRGSKNAQLVVEYIEPRSEPTSDLP